MVVIPVLYRPDLHHLACKVTRTFIIPKLSYHRGTRLSPFADSARHPVRKPLSPPLLKQTVSLARSPPALSFLPAPPLRAHLRAQPPAWIPMYILDSLQHEYVNRESACLREQLTRAHTSTPLLCATLLLTCMRQFSSAKQLLPPGPAAVTLRAKPGARTDCHSTASTHEGTWKLEDTSEHYYCEVEAGRL